MSSSNIHILCVDDDTDSCELIDHILTRKEKDYVLTCVSSPAEALALIKGRSFDLYIFDYQLPEISGIELCKTIRLAEAKRPVIFSAKAYPADKESALEAGATEYLVKPTDLAPFEETIKNLLAKKAIGEMPRDYSEMPNSSLFPNG